MKYLTVTELMAEYRVTRGAILQWIEQGRLRSTKLGSHHRIRPEDWQMFLNSCQKPSTAELDF